MIVEEKEQYIKPEMDVTIWGRRNVVTASGGIIKDDTEDDYDWIE